MIDSGGDGGCLVGSVRWVFLYLLFMVVEGFRGGGDG